MTQSNSKKFGIKFLRWGLSLFIFGFVIGFIPILHYLHGAVAGDVGAVFLKNMTLWWGCPAVLIEYALKTGGLGMCAIGVCYCLFERDEVNHPISTCERLAPNLCLIGLVGATLYACIGYVAFQFIWPNFYFAPITMGKNIWLAGQGIGIAIYLIGIYCAFKKIRRFSLS